MRMMSLAELSRLSKGELSVLLRKIVCALPNLREGSAELRNAHANMLNIRRAMTRPDFRRRRGVTQGTAQVRDTVLHGYDPSAQAR